MRLTADTESREDRQPACKGADWEDTGVFPDERKIRVLAHADSRIFSGAESLFCDVVNGLSGDDRFEVVASAPPENPDLTAALADAADSGPVPVSAQPLRLAAFHLYDPRRILASRKAMTESAQWDGVQ